MKFCAHTVDDENGNPLPENSGKWQPLKVHLRSVAGLAKRLATPLGLGKEAGLAGLLHDPGKYRDEFQAYLRRERGSSVETQHAIFGAAWAAEDGRSLLASALAVAGHHAGLHDCGDLQGMFAKPALRINQTLPGLIARFEAALGPLPLPPRVKSEFSAEFCTRLLFSCVVDADRMDTACWPETPPPDRVLETKHLLRRTHAERIEKAAKNPDSPLAAVRNRIFDTAIERAARQASRGKQNHPEIKNN